jgi:hypothetical protein
LDVFYERGALITMKNESGKCALAGTFSCCIYTQGIRKVYNKESILISQEEIPIKIITCYLY